MALAATLVLNAPYKDVIASPEDLLRVEAQLRNGLFSTLGIDESWEVPLLEIMPGSLLVTFTLKEPAAVGIAQQQQLTLALDPVGAQLRQTREKDLDLERRTLISDSFPPLSRTFTA